MALAQQLNISSGNGSGSVADVGDWECRGCKLKRGKHRWTHTRGVPRIIETRVPGGFNRDGENPAGSKIGENPGVPVCLTGPPVIMPRNIYRNFQIARKHRVPEGPSIDNSGCPQIVDTQGRLLATLIG